MGLLDNTTQYEYYTEGDHGNYQFTSLEDIINYFMVAYVGEGKIISKVNKTDVAFHAQRAMQELSFDTFKSIKAQEIELPPSLTMILPHDYVNYTKLSWVDAAGIKHPLYSTKDTSNPLKIRQESDGSYDFLIPVEGVFLNGDFSTVIKNNGSAAETAWKRVPNAGNAYMSSPAKNISVQNGRLEFKHTVQNISGGFTGRHWACWQQIDVTDISVIHLSAKALSSAAATGKTAGIVRIGFSTRIDLTAQTNSSNADGYNPNASVGNDLNTGIARCKNMDTDIYDVDNLNDSTNYIEFNSGSGTMSAATTLTDVDVENIDTVYILITSSGGTFDSSATFSPTTAPQQNAPNTEGINAVDDIVLNFESDGNKLLYHPNSTTWDNYKSQTPSENANPEIYSYDTDIHDFNIGERYGISPRHAQINGSFYIDNLKGLIHFSSNISGKTVILDYISDSLGTDGEMQVHKFAEEAMYRWILHAIAASRIQTQQLVPRLKKEKIAAVRQAKLRLSNVKLEELTQVLRGKSKWIKH